MAWRLTLPGLIFYSGTILPGGSRARTSRCDVFEALGAYHAAGHGDETIRRRERRLSGPGACGGHYTANTMSMALEFLGLSPAGSNKIPAVDPAKTAAAFAAGRMAVRLVRDDIRPRRSSREGGQNEARGLAVIAETKRVLPNKPIKYIVNSHAHFDHASGLAPFVAEGITIITQANNKSFLENALGEQRKLVGDTLAKAGKKPRIDSVGEKKVLKDDTRTIELHHVTNLDHSDGMLIAFLPKEKVLFTADFNIPAAGQPVSPSIGMLVQNVERLKLDFDRHVLVHAPNPDRPLTKADLLALAQGKS